MNSTVKTGEPDSRRRAFKQDLSSEAVQLGWSAPGLGLHSSRTFNQSAFEDKTPEVLLVKAPTRKTLDSLLEPKERKMLRQKFEDHRTILDLGPNPAESGGENSPVVVDHFSSAEVLPPTSLRYQSDLIEEFIAFEDAISIQGGGAQPESDARPFSPKLLFFNTDTLVDPAPQSWENSRVHHARSSSAKILPREEGIGRSPMGLEPARWRRLTNQGQIGDGDDPSPPYFFVRVSKSVPKGIQLLHIAKFKSGITTHPSA